MRQILYVVFLLAISWTQAQPFTNGLTAYWPFNGSGNETVSQLHGVLNSVGSTIDRFNNPNESYSYYAVGDHIRSAEMLRTNKSIAISIWVYPTLIHSSYRWIINQRSGVAGGDQFQIVHNDQDSHISFFDANRNVTRLDMNPLQLNTWNHIVVQTDGEAGDIVEGWINNVHQGSVVLSSDVSYNVAEEIAFGVQGWNLNGGQFQGLIDEAMIFDRTLTNSEILTLYEYNENPPEEINVDLAGHWIFNQNADDLSGNSNDGTVVGATSMDDRSSNANSAYNFNGTTDYVWVPDSNSLSFGDGMSDSEFSISAWINMTDATRFRILSKFDNSPGSDHMEYSFSLDASDKLRLSLFDNSANHRIDLYTTSTLTSYEGTWKHVVVTYDGSSSLQGIRFYIDGVEETSTSSYMLGNYVAMENTNARSYIGHSRYSGGHTYANGSIDDVRVYGRALNLPEVQEVFAHDENQINGSLWEENSTNIYRLGKVAVNGTLVPDGYEFSVDGKMMTEEVKVQLSENWPDFVFKKDYNLKTLKEVETFIAENKHLPEIPSEADVLENGINLGEMDAKLLQKIEELTLYLIEQNKKIEELQKEVGKLKGH